MVEKELKGDGDISVKLFLKDCIKFYRTHMGYKTVHEVLLKDVIMLQIKMQNGN